MSTICPKCGLPSVEHLCLCEKPKQPTRVETLLWLFGHPVKSLDDRLLTPPTNRQQKGVPLMPEEIPEIDADTYEDPTMIYVDLLIGKIALPVWLKIGRSRHRITPETKDTVMQGVQISNELRELARQKDATL